MQEVLPLTADPVVQAGELELRLRPVGRPLLLSGELAIQPPQLDQVLAQRLVRLNDASSRPVMDHRRRLQAEIDANNISPLSDWPRQNYLWFPFDAERDEPAISATAYGR